MHGKYEDLIHVGKVAGFDQPKWYDSGGVPRYCDFSPHVQGDIYADVCIFYEIRCQACGKTFRVCKSLQAIQMLWSENTPFSKFCKKEEGSSRRMLLPYFRQMNKEEMANLLHYGDPPRHDREKLFRMIENIRGVSADKQGQGCVGETMNCEDVKILEFWHKSIETYEWERIGELEIELE